MTDEQRATLQVVWEQLNGAGYDLNELIRTAHDTLEVVESCINRLEQLGVGQ